MMSNYEKFFNYFLR